MIDVAEVTGHPECLDGRVKTLHPKVHGGILTMRCSADHEKQCKALEIEHIDLVVVNLYPFEATVAKGACYADCVENIDIGGPAMVRAAAKNHQAVAIVTNAGQYDLIMEEMGANEGNTTMVTTYFFIRQPLPPQPSLPGLVSSNQCDHASSSVHHCTGNFPKLGMACINVD